MPDMMIDIYHGQNENTIKATRKDIDWGDVRHNHPEIKAVFFKGTEGDDFLDPFAHSNRRGVQNAGFEIAGIYIWPHSEKHNRGTIEQQAEFFIRQFGNLFDNEVIMLDLEASTKRVDGKLTHWMPDPTVEEACRFASYLEHRYGRKVVMYFGRYFNNYFASMRLLLDNGNRPWVLPAYGNNDGQIHEDYERTTFQRALPWVPTVRQFASQKRPVNAISGDVDWNYIVDIGLLRKSTALTDQAVPGTPVFKNQTHKKDTNMAKIVRVAEDDPNGGPKRIDNAVYAVSGGLASWISTNDEYAALNRLGVVPDWSELEDISREDLNVFVLVSSPPTYADDYTGIKTTNEDFRDKV